MLLTWCFSYPRLAGGDRGDTTLTGTLMGGDDVEVCPEHLPATITDPSVEIVLRRSRQTHSGCVRSVTGTLTTQLMAGAPLYRVLPFDRFKEKVLSQSQNMDLWKLPHRCSHIESYRYELGTFISVWLSSQVSCVYTQLWFGVVLGTLYGLSLCSVGTCGFNLYILFYLCESVGLLPFIWTCVDLCTLGCSLNMELYILFYLWACSFIWWTCGSCFWFWVLKPSLFTHVFAVNK